MKEHIQKLDKVKTIAYIQAHQGQLSMRAIEEIRGLWRTAAAEGRWISELHTNIHTAVALGSVEMLQRHQDTAKARHNYSDRVVRDGHILLERMKKEAAEHTVPADDTIKESKVEEKQEVIVPRPTAPLLPEAALVQGPRGSAIKAVHAASSALLADRENVKAGKHDPKRIRLPAENRTIRSFVDAWAAVFAHRAKPTGYFTKVERSIHEVMQVVSNAFVKGQPCAPKTGHMYTTFERIKKFNNPKGLSSTQMFMRFVLQKGMLAPMLVEFANLPPKDLEQLFLEDSLFRSPTPVLETLTTLANAVTTQVEWDFEIIEDQEDLVGASPSLQHSPMGNSTQALHSSPGGVSNASTSRAGHSNRLVFNNNHGEDNPIPVLRRSIGALTEYFRRESAKLGQRYSPQELRHIFDEGKTKAIGILVRENLCIALNHIFLSGFKVGSIVFKKHPWEFLVATAERLKQSARGLGGVGVPDAIEMVLSLTDKENSGGGHRRQGVDLSKISNEQLYDIRMRMFLCHCLNQQTLHQFLDAIFDDAAHHEQFMAKFYDAHKCVMLKEQPRNEILRVVKKLSSLPFTLSIDAEIW